MEGPSRSWKVLKESQEAVIQKVEKMQEDSNERLNIAAENIASLKKENTRLSYRNKKLEEEVEELHKSDLQMKSEMAKSIHIDTHTKAVAECEAAFGELKLNYEKETEEKNDLSIFKDHSKLHNKKLQKERINY